MKTKKSRAKGYVPRDESDEYKPQYMFSVTPTDLLVAVSLGQIDPHELALSELRNRGQDPTDGEWVGFDGHGRLENMQKKHNFKLRPADLIECDRRANRNEWTADERRTITRIINLLKANHELLAFELAIVSGQTVQYYTLSEWTK